MSTMTNLYYESNSGSFLPPDLYRFSPVIGYVLVSSPLDTLSQIPHPELRSNPHLIVPPVTM